MKKILGSISLNKISLMHKLGYGAGNFGYGLVSQLASSYLIFYATAVLYIPGSLIGFIISISVIWDAVTDPLMGYISDNTKSRFGRRHIYILIGSILVAICNLFLWIINPSMNYLKKFIFIFLDVILLKTFLTMYITPYTALGAELSTDYDERSSIQANKTIFFLLGIFFAATMGMFIFFRPTIDFPVGQLNPNGYKNMAIISSVLMIISGLTCFFITKNYIPILPKNNEPKNNIGIKNIVIELKKMWQHKDYKAVVLGYLFTNISSALIATIGLHIFTYTFLMDNYEIGIILGIQLGVSILTQPIWIIISKKIDKKKAVLIGLYISIIGSVIFLLLVILKTSVRENYLYMIVYAIVVGFGTGGLFTLPLSMIADTIDKEELRTGLRKEGVFYGVLTLGYKISQSIAIFCFGVFLDLIKFNANLKFQTEKTTIILGLLLPIGSAISFIFAIIFYRKYSLNKEKVYKIQAKIKQNKRNSFITKG